MDDGQRSGREEDERTGRGELLDALSFTAGVEAQFERIEALAREARRRIRCDPDVVFGMGPRDVVDLYPARKPGAPLFVFIPSNYWLRLSKASFAFIAALVVEAGGAAAIADNGLGPQASFDTCVANAHAALDWVHRNSALLRASPQRIVLGGHSSGAQLAALVASGARPGIASALDALTGLVTLGGIFDGEALRRSTFNAWLHLDEAAAERISAVRHLPPEPMRLLAACGRGDSPMFRAQTAAYVDAWRSRGYPATLLEPNAGHFSVLFELADARSPLSRALLDLLDLRT